MNGRRTQTYLPDGTSWHYGYDRLSQAVPETPSYDADGNMLTNGGWTYVWNAQDRLVSAAKGTIRLEFAYDYMGRRFEKKVYENNVLTKRSLYAYDGFKQIAEYDALDNNALLNTYLWQPEGLDVPLLRNGSEFYVSDANKNVVALMDTTGAVTDTYVYDPFGNCAHTGDSANPFRFSSEHFDAETGLVYYNYRYYGPKMGRWLKRDPIGEEGGVNLYALCSNELLFYFDYLGLRRLKLFFDLENMQNPYFSGISIACVKYGNYEGLLNDGFTFLPEKRGDYFRHTEEILTDMKKRVGNYSPSGEGDCNCIEHIQFAQHGGPGILRFGEEALDSSTLEQWEKKYVAYKYPVNDSEKIDAYNGMIHLEAEDKDFTFYSILSRISALLCKEGKVYVDFIQCYAAAGTNGNALMDYLETFFNENVTVTVYRDKAYLLRGKPVQKDYWDRFGKPVKERSLAH